MYPKWSKCAQIGLNVPQMVQIGPGLFKSVQISPNRPSFSALFTIGSNYTKLVKYGPEPLTCCLLLLDWPVHYPQLVLPLPGHYI